MPTMSFNMQMLRAGERTLSHRQTASTIYCVVDGHGFTQVGDTRLSWEKNDIFVVPSWAWHHHVNESAGGEAYLFSVTDAPVLQKLGLYREEGRQPSGDVVSVAR
jgi:gentisate 1,2-dioxygenase